LEVAQVAECLLSQFKSQSSNPNTAKKEKDWLLKLQK
jgi:hypothetical protein